MTIRVATFNLNNLFSRFNFQARVTAVPDDTDGGITVTFGPDDVEVRTFMGRLVREKDPDEAATVAQRIIDIDADVLAVQEVEHLGVLKRFNRDQLHNLYPHVALIEGNDRRLIDVGVMSKLPYGAITSHQAAVHPDDPARRVFSRDLLQVEILGTNGDKLFTLYNTHLKSHYVPHWQDQVQGAIDANHRRRRQAETISRIITRQERPNSRFVLAGDMNDPPASPHLTAMTRADGQPLINALAAPSETQPAPAEAHGQGPGPQNRAWTHRYNPPGDPLPEYQLFDHLWVSQALDGRWLEPMIDRRTKLSGNGSDHDPAWIELDV